MKLKNKLINFIYYIKSIFSLLLEKLVNMLQKIKNEIYLSVILALLLLGHLLVFIGLFTMFKSEGIKLVLEIIWTLIFIYLLVRNFKFSKFISDIDYNFIIDFFDIIDDLASLITFAYALASEFLFNKSFELERYMPYITFMLTIKMLTVTFRYKSTKEYNLRKLEQTYYEKIAGFICYLEEINNSILDIFSYLNSNDKISQNKFNNIFKEFEDANDYIEKNIIEFKENERYYNWKKDWNCINDSFRKYLNDTSTDNLDVLVSNLKFFFLRNMDMLKYIELKFMK